MSSANRLSSTPDTRRDVRRVVTSDLYFLCRYLLIRFPNIRYLRAWCIEAVHARADQQPRHCIRHALHVACVQFYLLVPILVRDGDFIRRVHLQYCHKDNHTQSYYIKIRRTIRISATLGFRVGRYIKFDQ